MPESTAIERLIEFVVARRKYLRLTQRGLADRAGINSGTLANIEVGRVTKAPAHETQRALESGLRVQRGTLQRVLDGEEIAPDIPEYVTMAEVADAAPFLEPLDASLFQAKYPPTDDERRIANEAYKLGITSGSLRMPDFWQWHPDERRRTFRNLENLIEEEKRNRERMKQHG